MSRTVWNHEALRRAGLAVNEGGSLVQLSAPDESDSDEYESKAEVIQAWRDSTPPEPRVFPAAVYVDRYSKQAREMGY